MSFSEKRPLCVDLDGTMILSDVTYETFLLYVRKHPFQLFHFLWWPFIKGKAFCKEKIIQGLMLSDFRVPVNESVYTFCQKEFKENKRDIYLVSGGHEQIVQLLAHQWDFVRGIWGTHGDTNLISKNKARFLVERFGEKGFDYIGNSTQDLAVWKVAHQAYAVDPSWWWKWRIKNLVQIFHGPQNRGIAFLKSLRPQHWIKNILVFIPCLLSDFSQQESLWLKALMASLFFSLTSSASYLLNDLFDLQSDRRHFQKRLRPLAKGDLSPTTAVWAFLLLFLVSIGGSFSYSIPLGQVLLGYFLLNIWYSFVGKKWPIMDVFCTATFYLLRLVAGSVVIQIGLSSWVKIFSFFFALSLGFLKRYREMWELVFVYGRKQMYEHSYEARDLVYLFQFGTTSGFCSIVILTLYIHLQGHLFYRFPERLWPAVVLTAFWVSSVWFKAQRGKLKGHEEWSSGILLIFSIIFILIWSH